MIPVMNKAVKYAIDGILLVNKPQGLTSNAVLQRVKHLFQAKKAGHTGSLDPLATGMLPICFGEATKVSQYLLDADKCYEVTGLLGIKTDTADAMGQAIAVCDEFQVTESALKTVIQSFIGPILQIPSMYSALKYQGKPLYQLARAGIEVERQARQIYIHTIEYRAFDGKQFQLTVQCSKGTYIRNLIEDIGEMLGVGAHVIQLHRCYTAGFEQAPMFELDSLMVMSPQQLRANLLPIDQAIQHIPSFQVNHDQMKALRQGQSIHILSQNFAIGLVRLYSPQEEFIGLGNHLDTGELKVQRLLHFNG